MDKLETDRLFLRKFKKADAKGVFDYLKDPQVNCFMEEKLSSLSKAESNVEKRIYDSSRIAVALKSTDELIGELFCEIEKPDTYSIGWHFNSEYAGKGYASESASAFINELFTHKNARRLYAYIEDDNYRSQQLAERLGMRREGLFLEFISFIAVDGQPKYENTYQYALLKKEWLDKK